MKKANLSLHSFKKLFITTLLFSFVPVSVVFIDTIIAGLYLTTHHVRAIAFVIAVYFFICFISTLISAGTSRLYVEKILQFKEKESKKVICTGIILAIVFGLVMMLILMFFSENVIMLFNVSMIIKPYAVSYMSYFCFIALLQPILSLLAEFLCVDGSQWHVAVAFIVQIISNILLSLFLCPAMGIAGISFALLLSNCIVLLVLLLSFIIKKHYLKFSFGFRFGYIWKIFTGSFINANIYLFLVFVDLILNSYITSVYGEFYLPIISCVILVLLLSTTFSSLGSAIHPFALFYINEDNRKGIKSIMKFGLLIALIMALIYTIVLIVFKSSFSILYSITQEELINMSENAIFFSSVLLVVPSIVNLFTQYLYMKQRPFQSNILYILTIFVNPLLFSLVSCMIWGLEVIWMGWAASYLFSFILVFVVSFIRKGNLTFPLYLSKEEVISETYNFVINEKSLMDVNYELFDNLSKIIDNKKILNKISLFIEEAGFQIINNNKNKKVIVEFGVTLNTKDRRARIVCRDNGKNLDITDVDAPVFSMNTYLLSRMVSKTQLSVYAFSTNININAFEINY